MLVGPTEDGKPPALLVLLLLVVVDSRDGCLLFLDIGRWDCKGVEEMLTSDAWLSCDAEDSFG